MFNYNKINDLIFKKKLKLKEVSKGSGLNHSTFTTKMLREGANPYSENIEKLADFLQVPIDEFFDRKIKIDYEAYYSKNKKPNASIALEENLDSKSSIQDKYITQMEESLRRALDELDRKQEIIDMYKRGEIVIVKPKSNTELGNGDGKCG